MRTMKKVLLLGLLLGLSCEKEEICDCDFVYYNALNGGEWVEKYRSTWDETCVSEILDETTYTYSDGTVQQLYTVIECK